MLLPILLFLSGIFMADLTGMSVYIGIPAAALAAMILSIRTDRVFYILLCFAFLALGAYRYDGSTRAGENDIGNFAAAHDKLLIYGTVLSDPEEKWTGYARYRAFPFEAKRVLAGGKEYPASGNILVKLFKREDVCIGDNAVIGGRLSRPPSSGYPGAFDYGKYLRRQSIKAVLSSGKKDDYLRAGIRKTPLILIRRFLSASRKRAANILRKHLYGPARAVTESAVLGIRSNVRQHEKELFIKTGTMHILAVSGLHVGIVAVVSLKLLGLVRCPRKPAYLLTVIAILAFAVFAGARPSSIRAAAMGGFFLMGMSMGRRPDIVSALALSAFLITFFRPGQLFGAGFILSYLAVISIVYITPLTDALLGTSPRRDREGKAAGLRRYCAKMLSVSLAIWIGMMPVIAAYFGIITPSVVLANFLAIPALFAVIILGGAIILTGAFGVFSPVAVFASKMLTFTAVSYTHLRAHET